MQSLGSSLVYSLQLNFKGVQIDMGKEAFLYTPDSGPLRACHKSTGDDTGHFFSLQTILGTSSPAWRVTEYFTERDWWWVGKA